jgi:hypothetical protein
MGCRRSYFSLVHGGSSGGHNPKVHANGLPQSQRVILQYRPAAGDCMPGVRMRNQVPASGADLAGFLRGGLGKAGASGETGFNVIMTGFGLWS